MTLLHLDNSPHYPKYLHISFLNAVVALFSGDKTTDVSTVRFMVQILLPW